MKYALFFLLLLSACAPKIMIKDDAPWYFPAVLEVKPGTTVVWDDSMSAVVHPVGTLSGPESFDSGHFTKTWNYTFNKPGIYKYFCPIHPYMQGLIGVDMKVPDEMIPSWVKQWPPAEQQIPKGLPESGIGEVWLDAQFQMVAGKEKPGAVIVIDAATWKAKKIIDDKRLNNPHNMWLSEDKNSVLQTNWFDKYLSVIDRYSGLLVKHVYVGESPAHVMTNNGMIYITLQGEDGIAVLDSKTYDLVKALKTIKGEHGHIGIEDEEDEEEGEEHEGGTGPHGHWISGKRMVVAHTEGGSISIWESDEKILEYKTDPLPLFAATDGKFAWTASFLTGKFSVFDIDNKKLVKEFIVGKGPVQAVPSPDGKYILVALSGDGAVAIINASTFELVMTLPSGSGAHGISYGPKKNGGLFAYISNKFVNWITVVDMDKLEVAGYIPLPKDSLGGQGILAVYE